MATIKFVLYKSNKRKDGSYPVCLRVSKKGKLKYIDLKLSSLEGQWNEDTCRTDCRHGGCLGSGTQPTVSSCTGCVQ